MKILIVEDNQAMNKVIRNIITEQDNQIMELNNSESLIGFVEKNKPDWLILDIDTKVNSSINSIKNLKIKNQNIKIIIITDLIDDYLKAKTTEIEVQYLLSKENIIEIKSLINSIKK
ncbi:MAG: hypothetical protein STSR0008_17550 [Ignavibacterium sp.]